MSAEVIAAIGIITAALIGGITGVIARYAAPRMQRNAVVVDSALDLVRAHIGEHDRDQATIQRLRARVDALEAENHRLRKGTK